jgi:hypothetical protein
MGEIFNSDLKNNIIEGAYLKVGQDLPAPTLSNQVVPVMEVNPKLLRLTNFMKSGNCVVINSGATILTTDANVDTYITDYTACYGNSIDSQATAANLTFTTYEGTARSVSIFTNTTGAINNQSISVNLKNPIKIKRGTDIKAQILGTAVGSSILTISLFGYYVNNANTN